MSVLQVQPCEPSLAWTVPQFGKVAHLGETILQKDARSGKLKTKMIGTGNRRKRIVLREDGIEYLRSLPDGAQPALYTDAEDE